MIKKLTINIHEHIHDEIHKLAQKKGVYKTSIITLALLEFIHKEKVHDAENKNDHPD